MTDLYTELAHQLPMEAKLGGAFLTMVEPDAGFEAEYNRWYEDCHFYEGVMHGPWLFAGRRWVAPRALRALRSPADSPVVVPLDAGCYISTYWLTSGHELEAERWIYEAMAATLMPTGRGLSDPPLEPGGPWRPRGRRHVYTYFHRFVFSSNRDPGPLKAQHALDHPFPGMVLEVVEAPDSASALAGRLEHDLVPATLAGGPAAMCVVLEAIPFTQGMNGAALAQPEGVGRRLCLMWFLEEHPAGCVAEVFGPHHRRMAESGAARLLLSAPFVPTVPGTDRYVDELR